ncbi:MAG TPA: glycosyltransferase [Nocardioidaceae bacterium]|nr:glycosyltransferase [Nocardioidaceae bacterium]
MRILLWHVHGSWTTSFVHGPHEYLLPVTDDRGPDGLGRARTWDWPASVREVPVAELPDTAFDLVVLQRPHELDLVQRWTGRAPGGRGPAGVPAVYVEHNTPDGPATGTRHPLADQPDVLIAHVTHFNELMWDCGSASTTVVEHGVVDPGHRYSGEWPRAAVVTNDPVRRGRTTGTDLLPRLARAAPLDIFGMGADELLATGMLPASCWAFDDLPQHEMHRQLARRRVYLHTPRWTSLGLSLIEAMHLGLPVVALATTEVVRAVPASAGAISPRVDDLADAVARFCADAALAQSVGAAAREVALQHYGLDRFLTDWDRLLERAVG